MWTIRCCGRCCRVAEELIESAGLRVRSAAGTRSHARAQSAAEVRRPRVAHHHASLRHPLPVLLSARISVLRASRGRGGRGTLGSGARGARQRYEHRGSDPERRRSAVAQRCAPARASPTRSPAWAHVQRIRVHTRQPIVLPSRVDGGLLAWLRGIRQPVVFVLHVNHPNEIDDDVRAACAKLRTARRDAAQSIRAAQGRQRRRRDAAQACRARSWPRAFSVLPAPARSRARNAHFDVAEAEGQRLVERLSARFRAISCRAWCARCPGAPYKVPVS